MATTVPDTSVSAPSTGRLLFWGGAALVILAIVAYQVQFLVLKSFMVPWYAPVLGTLGVLAMVLALRRRWSVLRLLALAVCGLLVAFEWVFLLALSRLPEHTGPTVGQRVPAFTAIRGDGSPFTDRDLASAPTVLLFFRGHW